MSKKSSGSNHSWVAWSLIVVGVLYFLVVPLISTPAALQASNWWLISNPNYPIQGGKFDFNYNFPSTATSTATTATTTQTNWQTNWQTQTQTLTPAQPGIEGATCALALPGGTDINMGQSFWAQVTSNRAGREVRGYGILLGEPSSGGTMTLGLTDGNGQLFVASPALNLPGLYQISAVMIFGLGMGDALPCMGTYIVTVHGLLIVADPDSIPKSTFRDVTYQVFTDRPGDLITVQARSSLNPVWSTSFTFTANAAGHASTTRNIMTAADWLVYRGVTSAGTVTVNEEWLNIT